MKRISSMSNKIKYFITLLSCFFIVNKAAAQSNNIYLDGDNYITLNNPVFSSRLDWKDASKERITMKLGQFPIKTYWFSHNGKSYIIINLTSDKSDIYIELGANKNTYHFPADYASLGKQGAYNNFEMYVENTSGILQMLDAPKGTHLSLKVLQLDSLHVKLFFSGTVVAYSNTDKSQLELGEPSAPMAISGKISLSKKSPELEHLPDSYPGCDNTIYNEMSPDWNLGQWYSATECEESFYKKAFTTLNRALNPAIKYLSAKGWDMSGVPKYKPLEHRLRKDTTHFFRTDPASGIDYDLDVNANPMKGEYHDFMQKILEDVDLSVKGDTAKTRELSRLQKEEPGKFKLHLQAIYNQPVQSNYTLDLSHARVKKINDNLFLIENVQNTSNFTFHDDGGTYLFIGKWTTPEFKDGYIVCSPVFQPGAKKLSIQAMYIRLGCGNELAETLLKHIDMNNLQQILHIIP
ncbi:MAG: hypothetical protein Q8891_01100 [Bacteroidota bacterium]|nr:hypothetical protein [Bacteroidota bacterium]